MSSAKRAPKERQFLQTLFLVIGTVIGANMFSAPLWIVFGIYRMSPIDGATCIAMFTILPLAGILLVIQLLRFLKKGNHQEAMNGH